MNAETQNATNFRRATLAPRLDTPTGESRIAARASPVLPLRMFVTASANTANTRSVRKKYARFPCAKLGLPIGSPDRPFEKCVLLNASWSISAPKASVANPRKSGESRVARNASRAPSGIVTRAPTSAASSIGHP